MGEMKQFYKRVKRDAWNKTDNQFEERIAAPTPTGVVVHGLPKS